VVQPPIEDIAEMTIQTAQIDLSGNVVAQSLRVPAPAQDSAPVDARSL
jgi:hypothetical protein